jgi:hypothetical protein
MEGQRKVKRRSFLFTFLALLGIRPKPRIIVQKGRACGPSTAPVTVLVIVNGAVQEMTLQEALALAA